MTKAAFFFPKRIFLSLRAKCFLAFVFLGLNGHTEAFGNSFLALPSAGICLLDPVVPKNQTPWGIQHQYLLGGKLGFAIDYNWWWFSQSHAGFGLLDKTQEIITSINAGSGIRYTKTQYVFRPTVCFLLDYLHFLSANNKNFLPDLKYAIWIGPKIGLGLEWIFTDEISLSTQADYGFYFNVKFPFRQTLSFSADVAFYL